MKYQAIDYARGLANVFSKKSIDHRKILKNFWQLLVKNRQTKLIYPILKNFYLIHDASQPTLTIETPFPLSTSTKVLIKEHYKKMAQKDLAVINESITDSHILGVRGQTTTHEFDWTIPHTLKQLKEVS